MTELVTCEVCPAQVPDTDIKKFHTMLMCPTCYEQEKKLTDELNDPAAVQARLDESRQRTEAESVWNKTLAKSKEVDQSIEVRTDLFNAETVAIIEIKAAIDNDENIPADKKQFVYTKTIEERIQHYEKVVFELGAEMVKRQNELRSAVTMFNNEVIKLRKEEQDQFKLKSINYNPPTLKKPAATKPKSVPSKKFDKSGIRTAAAVIQQFIDENKIPIGMVMTEAIVQAACVNKNMTADQAIDHFKEKFRPLIPVKS